MADGELGGNSAATLKNYVERIVSLTEERKALTEDITDVVKEAKGDGFDGPAVRRAVRMAMMEKQKRDETIALDDTYLAALGLI